MAVLLNIIARNIIEFVSRTTTSGFGLLRSIVLSKGVAIGGNSSFTLEVGMKAA